MLASGVVLHSYVLLRLAEHSLSERHYTDAASYALKARLFSERQKRVLFQLARKADFDATNALDEALQNDTMLPDQTKDALWLGIAESWLSQGDPVLALASAINAHTLEDQRRSCVLRIAEASLSRGDYWVAVKAGQELDPPGPTKNGFLLRVAEKGAAAGQLGSAIESVLATDLRRDAKTAQVMRILTGIAGAGACLDLYRGIHDNAKQLSELIDDAVTRNEVAILRNKCISERGILIPETIDHVMDTRYGRVSVTQKGQSADRTLECLREACSSSGLIPLTEKEVTDDSPFGAEESYLKQLPRLVVSIEIRHAGQVQYRDASGASATRSQAVAVAICKVYDSSKKEILSFEEANSVAPPNDLVYSKDAPLGSSGGLTIGVGPDNPETGYRQSFYQTQDYLDSRATEELISILRGSLAQKLKTIRLPATGAVEKNK